MESTKFRVAICGGGIGGLTFALALSKYPTIEVDVYEAASQFSEVGAGVGVHPRVWEVLKELGLEKELLEVAQQEVTDDHVTSFTCRKSDQPEGFEFYSLITKGELLRFHRADLHGVLLKHIEAASTCNTHCFKRLRSYSQHPLGPIELLFQDDSVATCDILVGADGVKSVVRGCMLREQAIDALNRGNFELHRDILSCVDPVWSGVLAYRTLISAERLRAHAPDHRVLTKSTQYLGKNAFLVVYPVSQGKQINFVGFSLNFDLENTKYDGPWVKEISRDEVSAPFVNFEPEAQSILQCIDKANLWAVNIVKPLHAVNYRRVAILGDAAHAMTPFQGAGAGQAIEDGYVLAAVLGHPLTNLHTATRALEIYDQIRRPFATEVAQRSLRNGKFVSFQGMEFDNCSQEVVRRKLTELGDAITRNVDWHTTSTVDDLRQKAIQLLEEAVGSSQSE